MSDEKRQMVYLTVIIDYLKVNGFRIASHSLQRTETPLSARADIKPLLPLIKEGDNLDILGLNDKSKITFCKTYTNEELVAHYKDDSFFVNAIKSIMSSDLNDVHFLFITNGILMPELLVKDDWPSLLGVSAEELNSKISTIEFYETRVNIDMLSKLSDQKVYLRNIISKVKRIKVDSFKESDVEFEDEKCLEGSYDIMFHGKSRSFSYWISTSGVQLEAPDNSDHIGEFVGGFK